MPVSLIYSNVLAALGVVLLPLVGWRWVAPQFRPSTRRYFFLLVLPWGAPFVLGQFSQADEWGPVWVQYHLLDLAYAPWGTALALITLSIGVRVARRVVKWAALQRLTEKSMVVISLVVMITIGYITEIYDTFVDSDRYNVGFWVAFDIGDYATLTTGAVVAVGLYAMCQRQPDAEMA